MRFCLLLLVFFTACATQEERRQIEGATHRADDLDRNLRVGQSREEVEKMAQHLECQGSKKSVEKCTASYFTASGRLFEGSLKGDVYKVYEFWFEKNKLERWQTHEETKRPGGPAR